MPQSIQVKKNSEKAMCEILNGLKIKTLITPMREYLISFTEDRLPEKVIRDRRIIRILPLSAEEAVNMLETDLSARKEVISEGSPIKVNRPGFKGMAGVVVSIEGEKAHVHMTIFGRMVPFDFKLADLEVNKKSELWNI